MKTAADLRGLLCASGILLAVCTNACFSAAPTRGNPLDPLDGVGILINSLLLAAPTTNIFAEGPGLNDARVDHRVVGVVLSGATTTKAVIIGGSGLATVEVYDEATGLISGSGTMSIARARPSATLLPDKRIFIAGGSTGATYHQSAQLYDPGTGLFTTSAGTMSVNRADHEAILLNDNNRVLIMGGRDSLTIHAGADLYTIGTDSFAATGSMATVRFDAAAVRLTNGKVLITGGHPGVSNHAAYSSAEIYDPGTGLFTTVGATMVSPRYGHTAHLMNDGRVLIVGGRSSSSTMAPDIEIFNPNDSTFSKTLDLPETSRGYHLSTTELLTPNQSTGTNKFLITGGRTGDGNGTSLRAALLYDASTNAYITINNTMIRDRANFGTAALSSGKVLLVGGTGGPPVDEIARSSEIYTP